MPLLDARVDDPKRQPGAYVSFADRLYYILGVDTKGPTAGMVRVENCTSLAVVHLTGANMEKAELVRAAPELAVPDRLEAVDERA